MSAKKENTQINIKSSESNFTPKELMWKYFAYLPLFIISFIVCFSIGIYIIRYTPPVYRVATRVFIKSGNENRIGGINKGGANN